jgi:hypothetical protein
VAQTEEEAVNAAVGRKDSAERRGLFYLGRSRRTSMFQNLNINVLKINKKLPSAILGLRVKGEQAAWLLTENFILSTFSELHRLAYFLLV